MTIYREHRCRRRGVLFHRPSPGARALVFRDRMVEQLGQQVQLQVSKYADGVRFSARNELHARSKWNCAWSAWATCRTWRRASSGGWYLLVPRRRSLPSVRASRDPGSATASSSTTRWATPPSAPRPIATRSPGPAARPPTPRPHGTYSRLRPQGPLRDGHRHARGHADPRRARAGMVVATLNTQAGPRPIQPQLRAHPPRRRHHGRLPAPARARSRWPRRPAGRARHAAGPLRQHRAQQRPAPALRGAAQRGAGGGVDPVRFAQPHRTACPTSPSATTVRRRH